jgi:hypothetical protein
MPVLFLSEVDPMARSPVAVRLVGCTLVIVAGLGLGLWIARHWGANPSPAQETALADTLVARRPAESAQGSEPGPDGGAKAGGKHALLVGVTKYDHLSRDKHLIGPANDVRLMRRLLEERYQFPAEAIVSLTEAEGSPDRRPTRANIERAFHRLAEEAREGDQVVILLAGHGDRQPESDPPDPDFPEPDGLDEIFLPADIGKGQGSPMRVPNAIVDNELGQWLRAITAKKAHVWIIFDCCHSGTMTRGNEVVRELPPDTLIPQEELDRARRRAAAREKTRGAAPTRSAPLVAREPSDYLVALYACRSQETTPECPQPAASRDKKYHGLLTYTLVDVLTRSAPSKAPLTYRELVQRIQVRYAGRPQGSPTPTVEGKGQDRVVLGTEQPARSRIRLTHDRGGYKVNAGDLYGLTTGSVLAVYSPAGTDVEPKLLGHVRVGVVQPFEAAVEPCAYEKTPLASDLPDFSSCQPVFIDYGLRRFKVAVQLPQEQEAARPKLLKALEPLAGEKDGLVEIVKEPQEAEWLVRLGKGKVLLAEASGNRAPFELPGPDSPDLADALGQNLVKVFRARNLIALASRFESERYRGEAAVNIEVEVLRHKWPRDRGEVVPRPAGGWVFHPGDLISFRVKNNSPSLAVDVTLLVIGSDFQIDAFYPKKDETGKTLKKGESLDTPPPWGEIGADPPFGPECLVVIAVPAKNPPVDFGALAQDGLKQARAADRNDSLRSPLGELLQFAMYGSGSGRTLKRSVAEQHGMRALTWRTEAK